MDSSNSGADGGAATSMTFRPTIQNDLDNAGCAMAACHAGDVVPMPLVPNPTSEDDWQANYNQVSARAGTQVASLLLEKASGAGGHVAPLADGDPVLERWKQWIAAGAPYTDTPPGVDAGTTPPDAGTTTVADASEDGLTWNRDIAPIMAARCQRCHGTAGAYSLETYGGAFGFGTDGVPNIIPGDSSSTLVEYCADGHQGIGGAEAAAVLEWVAIWGAPEQ